MIIAVDFDGTVVTHEYPNIGKSIGAEKVLKALSDKGHKIILYTMRSHKKYNGKDTLAEAEKWFEDNGIKLYGSNENPSQASWTDSTKPHADVYIDDHALGCPKKITEEGNVVVDWDVIEKIFQKAEIL